MRKSDFLLPVISLLILVGTACSESGDISSDQYERAQSENSASPQLVERGERRLEIHITDPENGDYDQSIISIKDIGAESVSLSIFWDEIETSPGVYKPDPNWLEIANLYYPANKLKISLVISVLDTTAYRLPEDLKQKSMDDPEVIRRFHSLLEYVDTQMPDLELASLAIGNEIDGVLGSDRKAWSEYQTFFEATAPKARDLWPGVPVGTKVMLAGLIGSMKDAAMEINHFADVVMATYYPLEADFSVRPPEVVLEDFRKIVEIYPGKEIHLAEIGYPTSNTNHSSPEKQAEFIRYMFQAWDFYADQITVLSYSWLTDLPSSSVHELENYYGLSDPGFAEFLRSLGLRTYPGAGEDKVGFQVFQAEAAARGW